MDVNSVGRKHLVNQNTFVEYSDEIKDACQSIAKVSSQKHCNV